MSILEILYEESFQDHIPIYGELKVNFLVEFTFDEPTKTVNLKTGKFWNQVTNEQVHLFSSSFDDISIDLWDDVLSCHSYKCDKKII